MRADDAFAALAFLAGAAAGRAAAAALLRARFRPPVMCGACRHCRVERHSGSPELVCWRRPVAGGERVPRGHYCGFGERR